MEISSLIISRLWNELVRQVHTVCNRQAQYELASLFRAYGCKHQCELLEYMFTARNLHRKFREAYHAKSSQSDLEALYNDLLAHLKQGLRHAISEQTSTAAVFFQHTMGRNSLKAPRCGVKSITGSSEEDAEVVSLWGTEGYAPSQRCKLKDNSATYNTFKDSRSVYIENNIPLAIRENRYVNSRIDADKAKKYSKKFFISQWINRKNDLPDPEWVDCWFDQAGARPEANRTYRSTLVVPIAMDISKSHNIETEFMQQWSKAIALNFKTDGLDGHNIDKNQFCFGYFCVDSQVIGYFDERIDKEIGYFCADMLYFYFYVYFLFTRLSKSSNAFLHDGRPAVE